MTQPNSLCAPAAVLAQHPLGRRRLLFSLGWRRRRKLLCGHWLGLYLDCYSNVNWHL